MAGETEVIRYSMVVDGQQQTAAAFENTAKSVGKTDAAFKATAASARTVPAAFSASARAANDNAKAFENLASKAKSFSSVTSRLGSEMASLGSSAIAMSGSVGKAGGALSSMSRIIAGAGTGAAVGGVAGAVGGGLLSVLSELVDWIGKTKTAEEELADSVRATNDAFEAQANSAERVAQRMRDADALRRGEDLRRDLTWGDFAESVTNGGRTLSADEWAARNKADQDIQDDLERRRNIDIDELASGSGKDPFRPDPFRGRQEWADVQARIARAQSEIDSTKPVDAPALSFSDKHKMEIEASGERFNAILEQAREADAELAELDGNTEKRYGQLRKAGVEAFQSIGQSAIGLAAQAASGQKITAQHILMGIGTQLVALGTTWLFEGDARVAESYGLDPSGYTLNAIGGGAVAAGLAMMAGSVAAGAGGRGGGSRGASRPRARADDPMYVADTTGGRSSVTNNIYMSSVVSPTAQDGQRVKQALAEADRQGLAA